MKNKASSDANEVKPAAKTSTPEPWSDILRTCGSFNLRKASRVVTQLYDDMLQPTGLRSTQVVLLVVLAAEGMSSVSRLARELATSPSTLSRTLLPLERDGLIKSVASGRRGKLVRLTAQGEQALLATIPYWQKAQRKFTDLVGISAWAELNEQLARAVTAIRK